MKYYGIVLESGDWARLMTEEYGSGKPLQWVTKEEAEAFAQYCGYKNYTVKALA